MIHVTVEIFSSGNIQTSLRWVEQIGFKNKISSRTIGEFFEKVQMQWKHRWLTRSAAEHLHSWPARCHPDDSLFTTGYCSMEHGVIGGRSHRLPHGDTWMLFGSNYTKVKENDSGISIIDTLVPEQRRTRFPSTFKFSLTYTQTSLVMLQTRDVSFKSSWFF